MMNDAGKTTLYDSQGSSTKEAVEKLPEEPFSPTRRSARIKKTETSSDCNKQEAKKQLNKSTNSSDKINISDKCSDEIPKVYEDLETNDTFFEDDNGKGESLEAMFDDLFEQRYTKSLQSLLPKKKSNEQVKERKFFKRNSLEPPKCNLAANYLCNTSLPVEDVSKVFKIISKPNIFSTSTIECKPTTKPQLKTYSNKRKGVQKDNIIETFALPDHPIPHEKMQPDIDSDLDISAENTNEITIQNVEYNVEPWIIAMEGEDSLCISDEVRKKSEPVPYIVNGSFLDFNDSFESFLEPAIVTSTPHITRSDANYPNADGTPKNSKTIKKHEINLEAIKINFNNILRRKDPIKEISTSPKKKKNCTSDILFIKDDSLTVLNKELEFSNNLLPSKSHSVDESKSDGNKSKTKKVSNKMRRKLKSSTNSDEEVDDLDGSKNLKTPSRKSIVTTNECNVRKQDILPKKSSETDNLIADLQPHKDKKSDSCKNKSMEGLKIPLEDINFDNKRMLRSSLLSPNRRITETKNYEHESEGEKKVEKSESTKKTNTSHTKFEQNKTLIEKKLAVTKHASASRRILRSSSQDSLEKLSKHSDNLSEGSPRKANKTICTSDMKIQLEKFNLKDISNNLKNASLIASTSINQGALQPNQTNNKLLLPLKKSQTSVPEIKILLNPLDISKFNEKLFETVKKSCDILSPTKKSLPSTMSHQNEGDLLNDTYKCDKKESSSNASEGKTQEGNSVNHSLSCGKCNRRKSIEKEEEMATKRKSISKECKSGETRKEIALDSSTTNTTDGIENEVDLADKDIVLNPLYVSNLSEELILSPTKRSLRSAKVYNDITKLDENEDDPQDDANKSDKSKLNIKNNVKLIGNASEATVEETNSVNETLSCIKHNKIKSAGEKEEIKSRRDGSSKDCKSEEREREISLDSSITDSNDKMESKMDVVLNSLDISKLNDKLSETAKKNDILSPTKKNLHFPKVCNDDNNSDENEGDLQNDTNKCDKGKLNTLDDYDTSRNSAEAKIDQNSVNNSSCGKCSKIKSLRKEEVKASKKDNSKECKSGDTDVEITLDSSIINSADRMKNEMDVADKSKEYQNHSNFSTENGEKRKAKTLKECKPNETNLDIPRINRDNGIDQVSVDSSISNEIDDEIENSIDKQINTIEKNKTQIENSSTVTTDTASLTDNINLQNKGIEPSNLEALKEVPEGIKSCDNDDTVTLSKNVEVTESHSSTKTDKDIVAVIPKDSKDENNLKRDSFDSVTEQEIVELSKEKNMKINEPVNQKCVLVPKSDSRKEEKGDLKIGEVCLSKNEEKKTLMETEVDTIKPPKEIITEEYENKNLSSNSECIPDVIKSGPKENSKVVEEVVTGNILLCSNAETRENVVDRIYHELEDSINDFVDTDKEVEEIFRKKLEEDNRVLNKEDSFINHLSPEVVPDNSKIQSDKITTQNLIVPNEKTEKHKVTNRCKSEKHSGLNARLTEKRRKLFGARALSVAESLKKTENMTEPLKGDTRDSKKLNVNETTQLIGKDTEQTVKRKRGRPRKLHLPEKEQLPDKNPENSILQDEKKRRSKRLDVTGNDNQDLKRTEGSGNNRKSQRNVDQNALKTSDDDGSGQQQKNALKNDDIKTSTSDIGKNVNSPLKSNFRGRQSRRTLLEDGCHETRTRSKSVSQMKCMDEMDLLNRYKRFCERRRSKSVARTILEIKRKPEKGDLLEVEMERNVQRRLNDQTENVKKITKDQKKLHANNSSICSTSEVKSDKGLPIDKDLNLKKDKRRLGDVLKVEIERNENNKQKKLNDHTDVKVKTNPKDAKKTRANEDSICDNSGEAALKSSTEKRLKKDKGEKMFKVGDIAWAQIGFHPFWPCLVTKEPGTGYHKKIFYGKLGKRVSYHVRFFGDKGRRAWISKQLIMLYTSREDFQVLQSKLRESKFRPSAYIVKPKSLPKWECAINEAEQLKSKSVNEKLQFFAHMLSKTNSPEQKDAAKESKSTSTPVKRKSNDKSNEEFSTPSKKRKYAAVDHNKSGSSEHNSPPVKRRLYQLRSSDLPEVLKEKSNELNSSEHTSLSMKGKSHVLKIDDKREHREKLIELGNSNLAESFSNAKKRSSDLAEHSKRTPLEETPVAENTSEKQLVSKKHKKNIPNTNKTNNETVANREMSENAIEDGNRHSENNIRPRQIDEISEIDSKTSSDTVTDIFPSLNSMEEQKALYKRNNLFRGVSRDKVCQHCFKPGQVLKCRGRCNGLFHVPCSLKILQIESSKKKRERNKDSNITIKKDILLINENIKSVNSENLCNSNQVTTKDDIKLSYKSVTADDQVQIITVPSSVYNTPPRKTFPPDFKNMTLAEQIDYKMKEIMRKFEYKTPYVESLSESSSEEGSGIRNLSQATLILSASSPNLTTDKNKTKISNLGIENNIEITSSGLTHVENNVVRKKIENKDMPIARKKLFIGHVTAESDSLLETIKPNEESVELEKTLDPKNFKCGFCTSDLYPNCFVCHLLISKKGSNIRQKCSIYQCGRFYHPECLKMWPQTQWSLIQTTRHKESDKDMDSFVCPLHVCHTCVSDDPRAATSRCSGDKIVKCLQCPSTYHSSNLCVPAGTEILSSSQIVCPRHREKSKSNTINTTWCFLCSKGGNLICCETCPTSVHPECLPVNLTDDDKFICEDCESGRLPLYDEIVWVKLGRFRWWPALILFPNEVPANIRNMKHSIGEFVVKFFGTYDYYWVTRGRSFLFQEGDAGQCNTVRRKVDAAFNRAVNEAVVVHKLKKDFKSSQEVESLSSLKPPPYIRIKVNRPVGNVRHLDLDLSSTNACECDPRKPHPCGPESDCLNRLLMTECNPEVCPAGTRCKNQSFEKREYPPLIPYKTQSRGWGLKTLAPIKKGQFVIEYVGELIDGEEYQRRIQKMHEQKEENYYFLTIDKDRMIDAGPKGNVARFMNHSCQPNCETQKWTVNGDTRVGLFATEDIPTDKELTFNYNLECVGKEKKVCRCGAPNCSGFIGVKTKQDSETRKPKKSAKKKAPEKPVILPPCFVCGKNELVISCNNKVCNKTYHVKCLNTSEQIESSKFICPWHNCNICSKRTIRCCVKCINSYCPSHSDGNVRYDNLLGFVCTTHDPMTTSNDAEPVKLKKNDVITEETAVTSTTSDDVDDDEDFMPLTRFKVSTTKRVASMDSEFENDSNINSSSTPVKNAPFFSDPEESQDEGTVSSATLNDTEEEIVVKRKRRRSKRKDQRKKKIRLGNDQNNGNTASSSFVINDNLQKSSRDNILEHLEDRT